MTEDEWNVTLQVVRNFHEYDSYARSPKKAVKALAKRCPNLTIDDVQSAFDNCLALLISAIDIVEARKDELWARYNAGDHTPPAVVIAELQAMRPNLPDYLYPWVIGWVWFWHHLK